MSYGQKRAEAIRRYRWIKDHRGNYKNTEMQNKLRAEMRELRTAFNL